MTGSDFAWRVVSYCEITGASVTSWKRTTAHNAVVGGVAFSAHLLGLAVDVVYDEPGQLIWRTRWAERLGLRLIAEGDHDHLQPLDWIK